MSSKVPNAKQTNESTQKCKTAKPVAQEPVALTQQADLGTLQRAAANPRHARPLDILALQRTVGNRAVLRLLQAKLTVGPAGDQYEREADRVAEQVMNMTVSSPVATGEAGRGPQPVQRQGPEEEEEVQTKPLAASITLLVQRQVEEEEEVQMKPLLQRQAEEEEQVQAKSLVQRQAEEEEEVQMKPLLQRQAEEEEEVQTKSLVQREANGGFKVSGALEQRLAANQGGGNPLPAEARAYMEPRFGADFSSVRVHTDGEAAQINRALSARAFTHGQDIYFRSGEYSPETAPGQQLLAHELTHTLQQGASSHIRGWWPQGHKLVTQLAFEQGDIGEFYAPEAQAYLVDRSPDIDFIQDQSDTMVEGIKKSAGRIALYESYIKHGDAQAAQAMWDSNALHYREPAYCMSHGEGGLYKQDNPEDINKAMTISLLNMAVSSWRQLGYAEALSRLSDALHQAEDRGSHGEGRRFSGHDVRLNIKKWAKEKKRQLQPWEKWQNAPPEAYAGAWDPDNFSINKKGAVLGIGFAQGALRKFAAEVGANTTDNKIQGPGKTPKREMVAEDLPKAWKEKTLLGGTRMPSVKSSDIMTGFAGKSGKGGTAGKKESELSKVFGEKQELEQLSGNLRAGEYEQATQAPAMGETVLGEQDQNLVQAGLGFYERGAGFQAESQYAEDRFRELGKSRLKKGGKKASVRKTEALAYLRERMGLFKDPQEKVWRGQLILAAYSQVFHEALTPGNTLPQDLVPAQPAELDLGQVYAEALLKFKELNQSRTKKGGKKKSERIAAAREYHNTRVAQAGAQAQAVSQAILYAYESVFNEVLGGVTVPQHTD